MKGLHGIIFSYEKHNDLREFDDAITFKVALMVKKYLTSRGIDA